MKVTEWLKQPETRAIEDLDGDETVAVHAQIIRKKGFLRCLCSEYYKQMGAAVAYDNHGVFVEIGSGGGFIKEVLPHTITSDVVPHNGVDKVFPAQSMPFDDGSVDGIFVLNCFHHFCEPVLALEEFQRVLVNGGSVVMIEPANTWWSRLIYTRFHHEPFITSAGWSFTDSGRLSGANGALPWIVFGRDREAYTKDFESMAIETVHHHTPFSYLISGGLSRRQVIPTWAYPLVRKTEHVLSPFPRYLGMLMTVVLRKSQTWGIGSSFSATRRTPSLNQDTLA